MSPFLLERIRKRQSLAWAINREASSAPERQVGIAFLTVIGVSMCALAGTLAGLDLTGPGQIGVN